MNIFLSTLITLGAIGLVGAVVLYFVSKRFAVTENSAEVGVREVLPGANCGGCGFKGCADFARACAKASSLEGLYCPVGGETCMKNVAAVLGLELGAKAPALAVLKCNGSCEARPRPHIYDGAFSCAVMAATGIGTSGCSFGCLGCGDCVRVCNFDALSMNSVSGLPEVNPEKCTSCGACVRACPRSLFELRPRGRMERRVWVACSSHDKGAVARKVCAAACIACGKCEKTCPFQAIAVSDNLSYIDARACRACGKCIPVCPTHAILATFNPPQPKKDEQENL